MSPVPGKEGTAPSVVEKWDQVKEGGISGYFLRIAKTGQAHFMVGSPAGTAEVFSITPVPNEGWTHLAGVYDNNSVKMYFNGTLERTTPTSATPGTSRGLLKIGLAGGGGGHAYLGSIDEVRVYNRALSAEEIGRLASR